MTPITALCITIHKNLCGLRRIVPCDTNPKILRFLRFLRVVLLVAAMPRCVERFRGLVAAELRAF